MSEMKKIGPYIKEKDLNDNFDNLEGRVVNNDKQINDRVDNIITTPADDVSAQEIIDARGEETALGGRFNKVESQLAENATNFNKKLSEKAKVDYYFLNLLESGQVTDIKLIGDSITVGVGAGGAEDTNRALIGNTGIHEANNTSPVWSNFFRRYINGKYPSISFFNAGIGGWSATSEGLTYGTDWYGASNDTCFVMLGTNDRADATTEDEFETNIETFIKGVESTCNNLIVMTAPPTLNDFDSSGIKNPILNLTMEQIDKVISRVCVKNQWKHISFYRNFLEYQNKTQTPLSYLLQSYSEGSHPVESGYMLMWKIFQQELGLIFNTYDWEKDKIDNETMRVLSGSGSLITTSTPIADFEKNSITYHAIGNNHPDIANFPMAMGGVLKTVKTYSDAFCYQEYIIEDKGWSFKRYEYGASWRPWVLETQITGNTANRPSNPITGMMYFDQTISKPIWHQSGVWKDATGTTV